MTAASGGPTPRAVRGRPRSYDPQVALVHAMQTFWSRGYAATSMDELSAAMGMSRPSIYAGFGDKHALFLAALRLYERDARDAVQRRVSEARSMDEVLRAIARDSIVKYTGGVGAKGFGCLVMGAAVADAPSDPDVRALISDSVQTFEDLLTERFRKALSPQAAARSPAAQRARLAVDMVHGLALRARAGAQRADLERSAEDTVRWICRDLAQAPDPGP